MTTGKIGKGKGSKRASHGKPSEERGGGRNAGKNPVRMPGTHANIHKTEEAEAALRESDRLFREVLESVQLVALMLDVQANVTFCNKYLLDLTGWKLEEVAGRNWFDLFIPPDADVRQMFRESIARGTIPSHYQNDILTRDGERRRIAWNNTLLRDPQGNIAGATSIGEDITDRKRAEEEIKIKSEELQSLNTIIHKIIETVDLKNRLEFIMDEALKIVGLEGGTICLINPDNTFDLAVHRKTSEGTIYDLTMHRVKIGECLCGNSAKDCKPLILNNRAEVLEFATREVLRGEDIRFHAAFPFVMGEKCIGVLCVFTRTDNKPTERRLKLLEAVVAQTAVMIDNARLYTELRENEEILSSIFKTAPGSMILSSLPDGKTVDVNNNFTLITGYSREEIIGKTTAELNMWADPSARDRFLSMLQADGVVLDFEADMNHKSGAIRNGLVSGHVLTIKGKKYLIGTFYDITERKRAEDELRASKKRLRELIDGLGQHMFVGLLTPDGTVIEANQPALAAAGLRLEDVLGRPVEQTYWFAYSEAVRQQLREAIDRAAAGTPSRYDVLVRGAEGVFIWLDFSLHPLRDETGNIVFIVPSGNVITERKGAEAALQRSEQTLRLFVEHAPASIAMFDRDMKYIAASRRFLKDYGLDGQEIIGRSHYEVLPEIPERWREIHRRCLAGAVERSEEDPFPRADGKTDWVRWEIHPWHGTQDDTGGIILFSEVITGRKRAEEAMREAASRLQMTVKAANVGLWDWDLGTNRVFFSPEWKRQIGYEDHDISNDFVEWQSRVHPDDRDRSLRNVQAFIANPWPDYRLEFRFHHKDGSYRWILAQAALLHDEQGKPVRMMGAHIDITERKQAEEELRRYQDHLVELVEERTSELSVANERLQDLDRLKSMFIASMSHELRTPLNSIIGFTGILLQGLSGDLNDEQKDQLRRVYGSGKHLLALISDVIDISKIEAGKMDARVTEFPLTGVLQDAVGTLKQEIARKGIDLQIQSPPDVAMRTDRRRLLQCVLNFLSNAVKFTEKGTIGIVAREQDDTVEIRVEDTGIGILAEDLPRVFESFVRLESPLKGEVPGTGLGLYLTKKIVTEILGGAVSVNSTPGAGSVFTLTIPKHLPERGGTGR